MNKPATKRLIESVTSSQPFRRTNELLCQEDVIHVKGALGALKSLLLVDLFRKRPAQIVYLCAHAEEAEEIKEEAEQLVGEKNVCYFPATVFFGAGFEHYNFESLGARLLTLEALSEKASKIVVAHSSGLLRRLPAPNKFLKQKVAVRVNDTVEFEWLVTHLIEELGFVRETRVEHPGEMCVRGGIIDVFPMSAGEPVRIEFWGDSVESIRRFDAETQRSTRSLTAVQLYPQEMEPIAHDDSPAPKASLLAYLNDNAVLLLDEPERIKKNLEEMVAGDTDEDDEIWPVIEKTCAPFKQVRLVSIGQQYSNLIDFHAKNPEGFRGDLKSFKSFLDGLKDGKLAEQTLPSVYYSCDSDSQTRRLQEIFSDEEIDFPDLTIAPIELHTGFVFPAGNIILFTDHQFYGRSKRLRLPKKQYKGLTPKQLKHLNLGDYVVHVDFGIGIFRGLKKITVQGHERECLQIEYRDRDMVYVRVERMDRVNKYSSKDGAVPQLSKLGSPEWQRLKARTKKKIKDIAKDLIDIYAKRKSQPGFAFSDDTLWQRELEASFPYEDTPDQVTATLDVKKDMESPRPMDRLICGDVGFGKTEIAVRAAFKAVLAGRQVAILVPTTILAYQHYNTFRERLGNFPVEVEMLSRFRTRPEQKKILERLKSGEVDILIGTHRLLSKDVHFKEFGLLVVDEEHRFGVTHKEKLKKMRTTIDVLTLTATPIPRTLQFSLMGARDMTHINTPPKDRLPIMTEILPFNKPYIRQVIVRELDRDGQVFFVHNRVRSIDRAAHMVSELIPGARLAVAHGQMSERELEKVMVDFMDKKYQILVSTMIIESGLDMPNVNTIIVNRADKLGLAQLYQLRGRVGRSYQRAYAYFIIPPLETLTEEAMKRLRAIEEFSDIGSGSQLALRDLEIRGAGNLLGAEQSGFIDTLGFDLYNKILDEAVRELKDEKLPETEKKREIETQVDMDFDAFLPERYVASGPERVDIYRRLTDARQTEEIEEMAQELQDRFGRLPRPVSNLLNFLAIRILGRQIGLQTITISATEMTAVCSSELMKHTGEPFKKWLGSIVAQASHPFEFFQNEGLGIRLSLADEKDDGLSVVKGFLRSLASVRPISTFMGKETQEA